MGKGGYAIGITNDIILDCWDKHQSRICKASWANSPKNCFDTIKTKVAQANAYITVDTNKKVVTLRAATNILPHTEILWDYQDEYVFPIVN